MRPPGNGWAFLYARVACGVAGVPGAVWPGRGAGLLDAPVGGGPPARSPHASLRLGVIDLEARPGPAAAHGHRSLAWPTNLFGALHTGGAGGAVCGGASSRSPEFQRLHVEV